MKNLLRFILLIIFAIVVICLGIFALFLSSDTLVFAFKGQENQVGRILQVAFDRPGNFSRIIPVGQLIDENAIKKSVLYNGKEITEYPHLKPEIIVKNGFVSIFVSNAKSGDSIAINADVYNDIKHTSYRIPKTVELHISDQNSSMKIVENSYPQEGIFEIVSENFGDIPIGDIRWYAKYPKNNEKCFNDNAYWDYHTYRLVDSEVVNLEKKLVSVSYKTNENHHCLIAGFAGQIVPVLDRKLIPFTLVGSHKPFVKNNTVWHKISLNSETNWADENMSSNQKEKIISKIKISPNVDIKNENLIFKKNTIELLLPLTNNEKYTISMNGVNDFYGREIDFNYNFETKIPPFFHMELVQKYISDIKEQSILYNFFSISGEKIPVRACKINFTIASQISKLKNSEEIEKMHNSLNGIDDVDCISGNIPIVEGRNEASISFDQVFDVSKIQPGIYGIYIIDRNLKFGLQEKLLPQVFYYTNARIVGSIDSFGKYDFLLVDTKTNEPKKYQELDFVANLKNKNNSEKTLSGVLLGSFDESGRIQGYIPENIKNNFESTGILSVRSKNIFAISSVEFLKNGMKQISTGIDLNVFFHENGILLRFFIPPIYDKNNNFIVSVYNDDGQRIKQSFFRPNEHGIIEQYITSLVKNKGYTITLEEEDQNNKIILLQRKFLLNSQSQSEKNIQVSLRGINFSDKGIPGNLKKLPNTDEKIPWYKYIFSAKVPLELTVKGNYAHGSVIKNTNFGYTLFEIDKNNRKKILTGTGNIDADGFGYQLLYADFASKYQSKKYEAEVSIIDPITRENIVKSANVTVDIPENEKTFDDTMGLNLVLKNPIVQKGQSLVAEIFLNENIADISTVSGYKYAIFHLQNGQEKKVDSGVFSHYIFPFATASLPAGSYKIIVEPNLENSIVAPKETITEHFFWVVDSGKQNFDTSGMITSYLYKNGEHLAETKFVFKNATGSILVKDTTQIHPKIFNYTGSALTISRPFLPHQGYAISGVELSKNFDKRETMYSQFLKPVDIHNTNIVLENFVPKIPSNTGSVIDVAVTNTDNNSISQVFVNLFSKKSNFSNSDFTIHSPMLIAGGQSQNILTGSVYNVSKVNSGAIFENVVFSGSVSTDLNGKAKIVIPKNIPPDSYTLRIESFDGVGNVSKIEKGITIFSEYETDFLIPNRLYKGDSLAGEIIFKNNSNTIFGLDYELIFENSIDPKIFTGAMIANIGPKNRMPIQFSIPISWQESIPYRLILKKNSDIIAEKFGNIIVDEPPKLLNDTTFFGSFTGAFQKTLLHSPSENLKLSTLSIRLATSPAVIADSLVQGAKNAIKNSKIEYIESLAIRSLSQIFTVRDESIVTDSSSFFAEGNYENIENTKMIIAILEAKKNGVPIPEKIIQSIFGKYTRVLMPENWKNLENRFKVDWILIAGLLGQKIDEKILKSIDVHVLSIHEKIVFAHAMLSLGRIPENDFIQTITNEIGKNSLKTPFSQIHTADHLYLARILYGLNRDTEAEKIILNILQNSSYNFLTISEKTDLMRLVVSYHARHSQSISELSLQSLGLTATGQLHGENPVIFWQIPYEKIDGAIKIISKNSPQIFIEWRENPVFIAPQLQKSQYSKFLSITEKLYEVDEDLGLNSRGEYNSIREISFDNFLKIGKMYKIRTEIVIKNTDNNIWKNLILKMPKSALLSQKKSHFFHDVNAQIFDTWDDIVSENFSDVFVKNSGKGDQVWEYDRYFSPKNAGTYLLPANFVYFHNAKAFGANSEHRYITIR